MIDDDRYCQDLLDSLEGQAPDDALENRLLAGLHLVVEEEENRWAAVEDRRLRMRVGLCVAFTLMLVLRGLLAPWSAGIEDTAAQHLGSTGAAAWKMGMAEPRYTYLAGPNGILGNHSGILAFVHRMDTMLLESAIWLVWMLFMGASPCRYCRDTGHGCRSLRMNCRHWTWAQSGRWLRFRSIEMQTMSQVTVARSDAKILYRHAQCTR